jgi:DNA (cytosine-5)-methyltransferase 1
VDWGQFAPAIERWEIILGRRAASPSVLGPNGKARLNPAFVEWMMGLPEGHVTGHGLRSAQELKMLGNGVCPQQARLALKMLGVA